MMTPLRSLSLDSSCATPSADRRRGHAHDAVALERSVPRHVRQHVVGDVDVTFDVGHPRSCPSPRQHCSTAEEGRLAIGSQCASRTVISNVVRVPRAALCTASSAGAGTSISREATWEAALERRQGHGPGRVVVDTSPVLVSSRFAQESMRTLAQRRVLDRERRATMSKVCSVCGKSPAAGRNVSHSHRVTNRLFRPNIQKVNVVVDGTRRRSTSARSA